MCSSHLFLISSASVRSILFLSFIVPIFAWNVPLVSLIFLEISSLSHYIISLYFFALITEEGFLISPRCSLELCIQMGLSFLFSFAFASLLSSAICKASNNHFTFCISFFRGWFWSSPPVQCYKPLSIVLQPLCLPDLVPWIYSSPPLYNHKQFECPNGFPYFLQIESEFYNKELMIWATVSSRSCFCWQYRASPSLAAKNIINLILVLTI